MTHTYALLPISKEAYAEIRDKLIIAGYDHALHEDSDHGEVINMHGIAVVAEVEEEKPRAGHPSPPLGDPRIPMTEDEVHDLLTVCLHGPLPQHTVQRMLATLSAWLYERKHP